MKTQSFTVYGAGTFPFDMLRYDRCWPATSEDAFVMNETSLRKVTLTQAAPHNGHTKPTTGRWKSFGWEVGT